MNEADAQDTGGCHELFLPNENRDKASRRVFYIAPLIFFHLKNKNDKKMGGATLARVFVLGKKSEYRFTVSMNAEL